MSSARKRQKATRMAAMIDRANQTAMHERHHANVMTSMAEAAARRHDALYAALSELVALKDLKDKADRGVTVAGNAAEHGMCASFKEAAETLEEYNRRKPLAWQRARELVGSSAEVSGAGTAPERAPALPQ